MRFGDIGDEAARSADDADLPLDLAAVRADDDLIEALSAGLVPPPSGPRDPSDVEGELVALLAGWVADVRPESLLHPPGSLPVAVQVMDSRPPDEDEPLAAVGSPRPGAVAAGVRGRRARRDHPQQALRHARLPAARRGRAGGHRAHRLGRGRALLRLASRRFAVGGRQGRLPGEVAVRRGGHRRQHRAQHRARRAGERPHRRGAGGVPDRAGPARRRRRRRRPRRAGPPARLPHHAAQRPRPQRGGTGRRAHRGPAARHRPGGRHDPVEPLRHAGSHAGPPRTHVLVLVQRPRRPVRRPLGDGIGVRRPLLGGSGRQLRAGRRGRTRPRPRCVRTARGQRARPVRCGLRARPRDRRRSRPRRLPTRSPTRPRPRRARSRPLRPSPPADPATPAQSTPEPPVDNGAAGAGGDSSDNAANNSPAIAPSDPPSGGSDDQSGGSDGAAANKSSDDSSQNSSTAPPAAARRVGAPTLVRRRLIGWGLGQLLRRWLVGRGLGWRLRRRSDGGQESTKSSGATARLPRPRAPRSRSTGSPDPRSARSPAWWPAPPAPD